MSARKGTWLMETTDSSIPGEQSTGEAGGPPLASLGMVLGVKDIAQAIKFYEMLGFHLDTALPRSDGRLTVAFLTFGSSANSKCNL